MRDTLIRVVDVEQSNPRCSGLFSGRGNKLGAAGHQGFVAASWESINNVIDGAEDMLWIFNLESLAGHTGQSDATGSFMQENPIDI